MSEVSPQFRPAEEQLRDTLREVLARPDYLVDPPPEPSEGMLQLLATLLRWLLTPLKWVFDMTAGLPDVFRWLIVVVLVVLLVAVFAHMAWTLMQAMSGGHQPRRGNALPTDLVPAEMTVTELEQAADQAFERGALIEAVRFLFRAALTGLSHREKKKFRRGMTNRQYLNHFRHTSLLPHLQIFVSTIELKWYGDEPCENQDYNECRAAYQQIVRLLRGDSHADAS